ncbi:MAG: HI1506-related protein [Firmicutes bacterium]|nr:HI1506-related protein [Bacillota bacterium]
MAIKIVSKRSGFRRCGIEHPDKPTIYPDGTFSAGQIKTLKAEPMLVAEEIPDEPKAEVSADAGDKPDGSEDKKAEKAPRGGKKTE